MGGDRGCWGKWWIGLRWNQIWSNSTHHVWWITWPVRHTWTTQSDTGVRVIRVCVCVCVCVCECVLECLGNDIKVTWRSLCNGVIGNRITFESISFERNSIWFNSIRMQQEDSFIFLYTKLIMDSIDSAFLFIFLIKYEARFRLVKWNDLDST